MGDWRILNHKISPLGDAITMANDDRLIRISSYQRYREVEISHSTHPLNVHCNFVSKLQGRMKYVPKMKFKKMHLEELLVFLSKHPKILQIEKFAFWLKKEIDSKSEENLVFLIEELFVNPVTFCNLHECASKFPEIVDQLDQHLGSFMMSASEIVPGFQYHNILPSNVFISDGEPVIIDFFKASSNEFKNVRQFKEQSSKEQESKEKSQQEQKDQKAQQGGGAEPPRAPNAPIMNFNFAPEKKAPESNRYMKSFYDDLKDPSVKWNYFTGKAQPILQTTNVIVTPKTDLPYFEPLCVPTMLSNAMSLTKVDLRARLSNYLETHLTNNFSGESRTLKDNSADSLFHFLAKDNPLPLISTEYDINFHKDNYFFGCHDSMRVLQCVFPMAQKKELFVHLRFVKTDGESKSFSKGILDFYKTTSELVLRKECPHFQLLHSFYEVRDFNPKLFQKMGKDASWKSLTNAMCLIHEPIDYDLQRFMQCKPLTNFYVRKEKPYEVAPTYSDETWKSVIFQILVGLYSLEKNGVSMNALEFDNIGIVNLIKQDAPDTPRHSPDTKEQLICEKLIGYSIYNIDNFEFYMPNYGYMVLLNPGVAKRKDNRVRFSSFFRSTNFTNTNGYLIPPPMKTLELIDRIGVTYEREGNALNCLQKEFREYLHPRIGEPVLSTEMETLEPVYHPNSLRPGDLVAFQGDQMKFKWAVVDSASDQVRFSLIIKNKTTEVDYGRIYRQDKSKKIPFPSDSILNSIKLLESYRVN
jgi:hypothetical protein